MSHKKKTENEYVYFRGARLSKRDANRVGLGIIVGVIGALCVVLVPVERNKIVAFGIVTLFALVGYVLGIKIFK